MIKQAIGIILIVVGGVVLVALLTGGGPLFPHVIGPAVLALVGAVLVAVPEKWK